MGTPKFSQKAGHAGLPDEVIRKDYPKCDYMTSDYNDTMEGIDANKDKTVSKAKKHQAPHK
jgi:hypothetical protein